MNKIIPLVGAAGYSLYAMGKLTDRIPKEQGYVITGIVGVAALWWIGSGGGWTSPSKNQATLGAVGLYSIIATSGYAIGRGILKQNPKISLIIAAAVAAGFYLWKTPSTPSTASSDNTK